MGRKRYGAAATLARQAGALFGGDSRLPSLFALTDPDRKADGLTMARQIPAGSGLILRTFGRAELAAQAYEIAKIAQDRGLIFLIAAEPELALAAGAHGVHWPNRLLAQARPWRHQFAVQSASAHSLDEVRRAKGRVDFLFVSPVFASASPSANHPIGVHRLARLAQRAACPVYALGGINARSINRLKGLDLSGIAAVEGVLDPAPI